MDVSYIISICLLTASLSCIATEDTMEEGKIIIFIAKFIKHIWSSLNRPINWGTMMSVILKCILKAGHI